MARLKIRKKFSLFYMSKGVSITTLKMLPVSAGAVLMIWGMVETAAPELNNTPLFKDGASYTTTIAAKNDLADIYSAFSVSIIMELRIPITLVVLYRIVAVPRLLRMMQ